MSKNLEQNIKHVGTNQLICYNTLSVIGTRSQSHYIIKQRACCSHDMYRALGLMTSMPGTNIVS